VKLRKLARFLSARVVVRGGKARTTSMGVFMSFRFTSKTLSGAAAMVAFGASLAAAQSGPTSTRRIPISKEAGGEVSTTTTTKTDTITLYKTDTLRLTNTVT